MKTCLPTRILAFAASSALIATPVLAEKAANLTYLNGMDAGGAQNRLEQQGFKYVSNNKGGPGTVYTYWWHSKDNNCVVVETYDSQVMTVNDAKDSDCGHSGGDVAAAAGVVAGAAILGALLSHKSHHEEGKNYNQQETVEFDRGYKDGLYNGQYHNYNRSDAYSHGYERGVEERQANLSHRHTGRGGYSQVAQFNDLIGSRAAGGMNQLEARGFRQVDNFVSGNGRYSIQYRDASRQCIQVITANGRLEDIRDIGQHPKCRSGSGSGSASQLPSNWYTRLPGAANEFARSELGKANFRQVDTFSSGRNGTGSVWYSPSTRQCLQVIMVNGRVDSAVDIQTHPRCR